jgi:hypothetical protein
MRLKVRMNTKTNWRYSEVRINELNEIDIRGESFVEINEFTQQSISNLDKVKLLLSDKLGRIII